ncbi:class I adenylate-forming enzyme family protein [Alsobacter sp. R-9]
MRIETFLRASAAQYPEKLALIVGDARLTYSDVDRRTDTMAGALASWGVRRGDRVVVFMDNSVEAVLSIFAVLKAGAVFSPVNPSTKADKLAYVVNNCRAACVMTQARLLPVVRDALADTSTVTVRVVAGATGDADGFHRFEDGLAGGAAPPPTPGISIDLAMLIYTSGSTGFPKGVMMTHDNIDAASWSITTYLENTADDIILSALPLSFDYGLYQLLMAFRIGGTLVLEKNFTFPQAVLNKVVAERATGLPLVPTMAALLLQMKDFDGARYPSLRYITNTAAALPPAHIARLRTLLPHVTLYSMYGLTECKRCTWLPPAELERRPGSVGIAIPNTEAYVVDDDGNRVAPGVVGELVIRGPHVMKGYWEDQAATDRALRPGPHAWEKVLYTGDLFRTDEEGFLYFVGRKDDIIKTRGEKVSPKEVENVIYLMDGVREAVVFGVDDPILGQALKAVVVAAEGVELSALDVIRHCSVRLEDFMVPRHVEFRTELPKTDTGKISRRLAMATDGGTA